MDLLRAGNVHVSGPVGAPALVFAHGFGCDQSMWRLVAPAFEDRYRCVLFDLAGAGGSDLAAYDPGRHATLDGYAQDLVALLEVLDLGPAVLVGHSVSAMIAVLVAGRRPELVASLVLVGPSPRYTDDGDYRGGFSAAEIDELLETMDLNYLGWSAHLAPVIMGHPAEEPLSQELTNSFCRTDPDIARRFARATFLADNRADLDAVRVPTLVLQSRQDVIAPPHVGAYVHARIPGSRLVVLDAVGHCPHLSAPQEVIGAMAAFLVS